MYAILLAVLILAVTAPASLAVPGFDFDGDGIPDTAEVAYGSDPSKVDTDGDGLGDGVENADSNGMRSSSETDATNPDTDGDGLGDGVEDANRNGSVDQGETSPLKADTDGDSAIDGKDNCPLEPNSRQTDWDFDQVGDLCDSDAYLTIYARTAAGKVPRIARISGLRYYRAKVRRVLLFRGRVVPAVSDGQVRIKVSYRTCNKRCKYKPRRTLTVSKRSGSVYKRGYRLRRRGYYQFRGILDPGGRNDGDSTVVVRVRAR